MKHEIKKLPKGLIEIEVELSVEEMKPLLEQAASRLQANKPIAGFRPGKAPYDVAIKQFGEMVIWQEAADEAVQKNYTKIVVDNKLEPIGSPHIDVLKLAPNNPFVFKATAALLPEVQLGDYQKIKIEKKQTLVEEKRVDRALEGLRKMQTKEAASNEPLGQNGKAVVEMDISLDGVPIEGGQGKGHSIYMDEDYYLPGLKEKIIGIKRGETKIFKLSFPATHFQKNLAGQEADFKVTATEIFELQKPPLDDDLAKTLGQKSLADLRTLIRQNLEEEQKQKDSQVFEIELLEKTQALTRFGDLPEILINEETIKMLDELKDGISRQGLNFEEYLKNIQKTREQLRLDFVPEAIKRVKTALILRQIAKGQKIEVADSEVEKEIKKMLEIYKNDPRIQENINSEGARAWLRRSLQNRQAIEWLKKQIEK